MASPSAVASAHAASRRRFSCSPDGTPSTTRSAGSTPAPTITSRSRTELRELLARIRALTRRGHAGHAGAILHHGPVALDRRDHVVRRHGEVVPLTATEFRLLEYLMLRPQAVISREELARHVWADTIDPESNAIDVYIGYLRKKLGADDFPVVRTVRGSGYTLHGGA